MVVIVRLVTSNGVEINHLNMYLFSIIHLGLSMFLQMNEEFSFKNSFSLEKQKIVMKEFE